MMRGVLLVLALSLLSGCGQGDPTEADTPKAVYLVAGQGHLSADHLAAHPEVLVVRSPEELAQHATERTALWIDTDAANSIGEEWLGHKPQRYYPMVLVGEARPLYAFRETLHTGVAMSGPPMHEKRTKRRHGFSVWMLTQESATGHSAIMRGYDGPPTVERILTVTNQLLEGELDDPYPEPDADSR